MPALTGARSPVTTSSSSRGKRQDSCAARPTLRPAAHCPTPVARDTSEDAIASTNPTWCCTSTGPRSVSRISSEDACAIATSCAPSTALTAPCSSPAISNSSPDSIRDACPASSTPIADASARRAAIRVRSLLVDIPHHIRTRVRLQELSTTAGAAGQPFSGQRTAVRLFGVTAPRLPPVVAEGARRAPPQPRGTASASSALTDLPERRRRRGADHPSSRRLARTRPERQVTWPAKPATRHPKRPDGSAAHRGEAVGGLAGVGTARPPTPRTRATPTVSPCSCR